MKTTSKVRTLAATIITIGSLVGGANAAVSATVTLNSSTEIEVILSGTFSAPVATSYSNELLIDFGTDIFTSGIHPISRDGTFNVEETEGEETRGSLFNNFNTVAYSMQVIHSPHANFSVGDHVSGTVVFSYSVNHLLNDGQPFDLYWGTSKTGAGTSLQFSGIVNAVPEPSSTALLGLGGLALILLRRR